MLNSLNELHTGWIRSTLGKISEVILGQSPPSSTYNQDGKGLPFYQSKLEFGYIYPSPQKWCSSPKKVAEKNDVLVSVRAPVGPTNICPEKSCIGRGLAAIRPIGGIESFFVLFLMRAFEKSIAGKGTGTTFKAITDSQLSGFEIPLPPISEQHRIVAKIEELFTKLEAGIAALKKAKAQLKRYRQAVLKHAFDGSLTQEWREANKRKIEPASELLERIKAERKRDAKGKFKELPPIDISELPELPDGWVWTRVGEIGKLIQYGTSEKAHSDATGIPVIRMGNISDGKIIFDELKHLPKEWPHLEDYLLQDGDVLFNRTNSAELVGKTAVYKNYHPKAAFASYLIRVRPIELFYNSDLLSFFINSFYGRKYIASVVSQQVGQANVNGTKLSFMPIPFPPPAEQQKICEEIESRLSMADDVEKATEQSLNQSERLRQSILKQAFAGKLVPQDLNDEPAEKLLERIKAKRAEMENHKRDRVKTKKRKLEGFVNAGS